MGLKLLELQGVEVCQNLWEKCRFPGGVNAIRNGVLEDQEDKIDWKSREDHSNKKIGILNTRGAFFVCSCKYILCFPF